MVDAKTIKEIKKLLTISFRDCRKIYINHINETLNNYELENIPFKKYKNRLEVLNTIKKINSDNELNLEDYLIDYGDEFKCEYLELDIIIKPNGTLYICFDNYDEKNIKFKIMLPTNKILNRDEIFFIPPISICKKIKKDFKYIYKWLGLDETYDEIKKRVKNINYKVYQDFYKYDNFLSQSKPIYLKAKEDEHYGFDIYIGNDTKLQRNEYNSYEKYKKAIIDEYVENANNQWRNYYVTNWFNDKDFGELLDEYRKDLNSLFDTMKNELISVGYDDYLKAYIKEEILQINKM